MVELLERGFADGAIVDVALAILAIEAVALLVLRARTGRGLPIREVVFGLAAGACLMLLVRAHVLGAPWPWQALALAAAGAFHAADLASRVRR